MLRGNLRQVHGAGRPGLTIQRAKDTHSNNRFTYRFGTYTKEQLQIDKIPDDSMISNYRGYQGECSSARVTSDFLKFPVISLFSGNFGTTSLPLIGGQGRSVSYDKPVMALTALAVYRHRKRFI